MTRQRPPMGWNSWDCYGTTVTEAEVLSNAEFMAEHLLEHGWDTVVVDIDWSDPSPLPHGYNAGAELSMDKNGRLLPALSRFPSARGGAGFGPLAKRIHDLGLRCGIHVMRGIPRRAVELGLTVASTHVRAGDVADWGNVCEWNPHMLGLDHAHPAAQAYYDSTLELYAQWGVDFIKADDMLWPYQSADIEAYARAIARCGRPMQLSLSPGRDLSLAHAEHLRSHATMWRVCDDLWDRWEDVEANFARLARWAPFAGDGGWPDADMLPLGRIGIRAERGTPRDDGFTPAERVTVLTLWVMARSPLMLGGDLPTSDPRTIALFTRSDVLEILTTSWGNREVLREDPLVLWTAHGPGGVAYVAAFNLGGVPLPVTVDCRSVDLPAHPEGEVRELWTGRRVPTGAVRRDSGTRGVLPGSSALAVELEAHGAALLRYAPAAEASGSLAAAAASPPTGSPA